MRYRPFVRDLCRGPEWIHWMTPLFRFPSFNLDP